MALAAPLVTVLGLACGVAVLIVRLGWQLL
jgi:hypothetical protein